MGSEVAAGVMFNCPGVHHEGCPSKATLAIAIGGGRWSGLSVKLLVQSLERQGWIAGVIPSVTGGVYLPVLDPLCPACGPALRAACVPDGSDKDGK